MSRDTLRTLVPHHEVANFVNYQDYLRALYNDMKENLDRYSFHQFSEDLGLGHSNVSWLIVSGRRRVTANTLKKILYALELSGPEAKYLSYLVQYNNARQADKKEKYFKLLMATKAKLLSKEQQKTQLEYLSKWYHPVIREMTRMKEFVSETRWILSKFYASLLPKDIKRSLSLLEDLKLIKYSHRKQRHIATDNNIGPDHKVRQIAMVGFHRKMLEIAAESLSSVPAKRRDFNAITVCIPEKNISQLKAIIHQSCQDIIALEKESQDGDQVYQVNIQMFPFTRD